MAVIEEISENYRLAVAGPEILYPIRYGPDPNRWPAFTRTGLIFDTGIECIKKDFPQFWRFECRSGINVNACDGTVLFTKSFGHARSAAFRALLEDDYNETRKQVYFLAPMPLCVIDIRTISQVAMGCCPKALLAALLGEEET